MSGLSPADATSRHMRRLADALSPASAVAPAAPAGPTERERILEAARREGYAQGLSEADAEISRRVREALAEFEEHRAQAESRTNAAIESLAQLARGVEAAVSEHQRIAEETAVEAAYAALLRLLEGRADDRSLLLDFCRQALHDSGIGAASLRVAPSEAVDVLRQALGIPVIEDASLGAGQCVVESARGASDTGLDVRLEAMRQAFLGGLAAHRRTA